MLHQFATIFDLQQEELGIIKEHLSRGEAALLDQARRSLPLGIRKEYDYS
jgi:hypothetical protein